jgi:hypothetical protein
MSALPLRDLDALLAKDIQWMAAQMGVEEGEFTIVNAPGGRVADVRYTRLLRKLADEWMTMLEDK